MQFLWYKLLIDSEVLLNLFKPYGIQQYSLYIYLQFIVFLAVTTTIIELIGFFQKISKSLHFYKIT